MTETALSSCIPRSIMSLSSGDRHGNHPQLQNRRNSLQVLSNKRSTTFASALWSQQQTPTNHQQLGTMNNSMAVDNKFYNRLTVQTGMNRSNNTKILPVISPTSEHNNVVVSPSAAQSNTVKSKRSGPARLNKFVRRLHDMLSSEQSSGIVEWRKGLLVLHSTDAFTKKILPKYFGTKNFKTFRRQLNYYGFVHVRSFSATGTTTTALWVNQELAKQGAKSISSVLLLKRVEPAEVFKTAEGRRVRKEEAAHTVEGIGVSTQTLQLEQIHLLNAKDREKRELTTNTSFQESPVLTYQVSQTGTESTVSNTSSNGSNTSLQVPLSIHVPYPCKAPQMTQGKVQSQTCEPNFIASDISESTDDAANLLLMLSRSIV